MTEAALARMEQLGRAGLMVSICCGPSRKDRQFTWSVDVVNREGWSFEEPYRADNFEHAIAIAEVEARRRGWIGIDDETEGKVRR